MKRSPCFECCDERIPLAAADAFECGGFIPLPRLGESNGFVERNDDQALGSAVVCNRIGHVKRYSCVVRRSIGEGFGTNSVARPEQVADDIGCVPIARFEELGVHVERLR